MVGLSAAEAASVPLWVVADVSVEGRLVARNFYYLNYESSRGSLFAMPKTSVTFHRASNAFVIRNTGDKPAINVHFDCDAVADRFLPEDDFIWLEPGEEKDVVFTLTDEAFALYDKDLKRVVEPGAFTVFVGADSTTRNAVRITLK